MSIEVLLALVAALAGVLGFDALRRSQDRRAAEQRLDGAQAAAKEAEQRARDAEAAAARAAALRERERAQAAAQKELDDGLQKVESDLPGAVDDALRDARSSDGAA